MKQAQLPTATLEVASKPVSAENTATGVFDTWSGSNLWKRKTFTSKLQWGVRYSQSDPVGLKGGINPMVYGLLNPQRHVDELGLFVLSGDAPPAMIEYVSQQMPKLRNHPTIPAILAEVTGCDLETINLGLGWGDGPTIEFFDLPGNTAGWYFPSYDPEKIAIDEPIVQQTMQSPCDAAIVGLGIAILHEYAHYLYYQCNGCKLDQPPMEKGWEFQNKAYNGGDTLFSIAMKVGCGGFSGEISVTAGPPEP